MKVRVLLGSRVNDSVFLALYLYFHLINNLRTLKKDFLFLKHNGMVSLPF